MMKRKRGFKRACRGFSLAEVIISMTLVIMISAIGYIACVVATRIGTDSEKEVKGYEDAEKFYLCLSAAFRSVDGDYTKKDEYVHALVSCAEYYFQADGLEELFREQTLDGGEWTAQISSPKDGEESADGFGIYYYGAQNGLPSYSFRLFLTDADHETSCYVNCFTADFQARIEARKKNSNLAFYEKTYRFAGEGKNA